MSQNNNTTRRLSGWPFKLAGLLLIVLMCAIAAEATARAFWCIKYNVPFGGPSRILYAFYPQLREVDTESPSHSDEIFDILLLGSSAFHREYGTVERYLREQLADEGYRKVRIFNLSEQAQTSRDSWLKYASLGRARFDMVVFYHGINETRANNAPPALFRADYGHYGWYEIVNELAPYHRTSIFALPYTFRFLAVRLRQLLNKNEYIPTHSPRLEWVHHGGIYRSAASFESNLSAIIDLSRQRGDRILLMTYATYIPMDYSLKAFLEMRLDYTLHLMPIEIWGNLENVIGAVAAHNEIIRRLAAKHNDVLFVDQAVLMKGSARYFNDPCHFTPAGLSTFVQHIIKVLLPAFKNSRLNFKSKE